MSLPLLLMLMMMMMIVITIIITVIMRLEQVAGTVIRGGQRDVCPLVVAFTDFHLFTDP